jgi:hypothetical protein
MVIFLVFPLCFSFMVRNGCDSLVSIVTRLWARFYSWQGHRVFILSSMSLWGPPRMLFTVYLSAKLATVDCCCFGWMELYLIFPCIFTVWCLIKHRDKFSFAVLWNPVSRPHASVYPHIWRQQVVLQTPAETFSWNRCKG